MDRGQDATRFSPTPPSGGTVSTRGRMSHLPSWRWAARAASLPGALAAPELGYRMFLPIRPFISCLFGRIPQLRAARNGAKLG
jgi:hypothetical protein